MPGEALLTPSFLARLDQLEIVSRRLQVGRFKGDRLSKRRGSSVEFADHRHYVVGDDFRHLDWNLFARLDKLFIRLYQEEEDLSVFILVDTSASMNFGNPTKFQLAKQIAASIAYIALVNMDRITVGGLGESWIQGPMGLRGRKNVRRLLSFVDGLETTKKGSLHSSIKHFTTHTRGKGVAVIISDFLDKGGFQEPLRMLVSRQMELYAVHILADEELDPKLEGDLKLTDIEDADVAEITITPAVIQRYKKTLAAFRGSLQAFCRERGVQYLPTSSSEPFDKLILSHLRQRGLVS